MVKDQYLRFIFIPVLGITIPYLSNVISYSKYSAAELAAITLYFIFMSWSIWASSAWLHHKIRKWFAPKQNIFVKISTISLTNALFGGAIAGVLTLVYYKLFKENFAWTYYLLTIILSVLAVILFTLVYEILYLSKEREMDSRVVDQLYYERSRAELSNLQNELEPHFIFNALNTLSYLILNQPVTAHRFNGMLASVYKYFLVNKEKVLISLADEIEFIENYFFLLQIRFGDDLVLSTELNKEDYGEMMIVPFALQIAVENAIKHNEFNERHPLNIVIRLQEDTVVVKNNLRQKQYNEHSTGIGLKNLQARYRLTGDKVVKVSNTVGEYTVHMPLIVKK